MVTYMFICNKCDGEIHDRVFEVDYFDYRTAEISPMPKCPKCKTNKYVTRFFGHNIFASAKSSTRVPDRYIPMNNLHRKSILSIGMRLEDENEQEVAEKIVQKLVDVSSMEVIENNDPEKDVLTEKLDLKKGTLDRKLFEIRQKHMLSELKNGKKISGFFMPITGETNN